MASNQRQAPGKCPSSPQVTRRDFLKGVGGAAVTASLAGGGLLSAGRALAGAPAVNTLSTREINVGTFGPAHCAVPFVLAKLKGYFGTEKLTVNVVNYPEMPLIAKDLIGGKLDFGQLVVPLTLAAHVGGKPFDAKAPLVITQIAGTNGAALMIRKGAGIKAPPDFKGRVTSNHSKMSVHYLVNMLFLERHGLDIAKDVQFKVVELGKAADAMKAAEVDSFVMPEPKNAAVESAGIGDVFMLSKYLWPNHPCCAVVTRRPLIEKEEGLVAAVSRAIARAGLEANEPNAREEVIDRLTASKDYGFDKVPKPVLLKALVPGRADFNPFPYQSSARAIITMMKKFGLLPATTDDKALAQEVFLSKFARRVLTEIGANVPDNDMREEKIIGQLMSFPS